MYFALLGPSTNLNTQPQQWATLFTLGQVFSAGTGYFRALAREIAKNYHYSPDDYHYSQIKFWAGKIYKYV